MHTEESRRGQKLDHVVPVGHRIHAVGGGRGEAEVARQGLPVDGKGGARESGRAQRKDIDPPRAVAETLPVPLQHEDIGEEMVGEQHGLSALEMRVAGHGRGAVPLGLGEQSRLHAREPFIHVSQDVAQIEALVEGDLVIARPPRVELAAHGPGQLDEPPLHVHVDVLELLAEGKAAALQLALHGFEPGFDLSQLAGLDEPGALEGAGPGEAAANVLRPEPTVEGQGRGEGLGHRIRALREAAAPGLACARTASGRGHEASASPRRADTGRPASSSAAMWLMMRRVMSSRSA